LEKKIYKTDKHCGNFVPSLPRWLTDELRG